MHAHFRPTFLLLLLAASLGAGCHDGMAARRQAVVVTITAEAPGYDVYQVENLVATPLAVAVNGTPGVQEIRSRVTSGRAVIWVESAAGTDPHQARRATAERLQQAVAQLPTGVVPTLAPVVVPDQILLVALWFAGPAPEDPARRDTDLRSLAEAVVRRRLLTMVGVAEVVVVGGRVEQCQVIVSPEKTVERGLTITDVVSALEKALGEERAAQPGRQETLVVRGGLTAESLGESVVAFREVNAVRLRDVAEVRLTGVPPRRHRPRLPAETHPTPPPAVLLGVVRRPESETKRLSQELNAVLEQLRPNLPPDLSLGRELPAELAPLAAQAAEEILQDQPPEVTLRQETSADLGAVLVRESPPRTILVIRGPERDALRTIGRDLADRLRKVPGVADVQADSLEESPQTRIDVDRERAALLAVSMGEILATVAVADEGRRVGRLEDPRTGRAVDVVVTFGPDRHDDAASLPRLPLTIPAGGIVPLGQVARIERVAVPRSLDQVQMQPAVLISCAVPPRDRGPAMAEIQRAVAACQLPPGYHVECD